MFVLPWARQDQTGHIETNILPYTGSPRSLGTYDLNFLASYCRALRPLAMMSLLDTGGIRCSLNRLFFGELGHLFLHVLRCKSPRRLKYLMCLRSCFSLDPGDGMETGPCDTYRLISNSALSMFTNERVDVKTEQRTMRKISLTQ